MATLALSATNGKQIPSKGGVFGGLKTFIGELTLDSSYPDDGYTEAALLALLPGWVNILHIFPAVAVSGSGETGNLLAWDASTATLRAYEGGADGDPMDEVPDGENILDGAVASVVIIGS